MKDAPNSDEALNSSYQLNPPKKEVRYYAKYGGIKDDLYGNSHIISVKIQIEGVNFFTHTNVKLEIKQKINARHEFTLICDPGEFGESNTTFLLQNSKEHLGKRITFQFQQYGKSASIFTGIITGISTSMKGGIRQITLRGSSPSILMENGLHCRSFENKTFEEIIKEIIKDYPPNLINFHINPNYKEKLNYIVQYNSTDFQFIQKLATRFGEYFYYNGDQFCFSAWGGKIIELMEGEDVYDYELKLEVQPQAFSYTSYDAKQGSDYTLESKSQSVHPSQNPFQQYAKEISEKLYTVPSQAHYDQSLLANGFMDMQRSLERDQQKRQNLVYIEATSNNPQLRVGDVAKMMVWIPGHEIFKNGQIPMESYKITEIVHTFEDGLGYINKFKGVPKDLPVPPYYDEREFPQAQIQHAIVTDNQDPLKMGRIRVQFVWQRSSNSQTPWIQVIQPHAGGEKGAYFNPEVGETVLCAFQAGNAEAPIVLGTSYNGGEISEYYSEGNDIKVLQTRSGTKFVFNDAEGSILIEDPSGNTMFMDGKGNIKVNAPKDIEFTAGEDMKVNVGNNLNFTVGNQATYDIMQKISIKTPFMQQLISNYFHTQAGKALINSENQIKIESPETFVQGGQKLFLHSDELATLNSQGIAEMKGETKNSLSNISNSYEPQREEIKAKCLVMFRPHGNWKGEYGFDWFRMGDSGLNSDPSWFGKIIGKYYTDLSYTTVFPNTNSWSIFFKQDWNMYNKILRTYKSIIIPWKSKIKGNPYLDPIPIMTMLKGEKHKLNLKIEINKKPKKLFVRQQKSDFNYFNFKNSNLEIRNDNQIYSINNKFELECIKSFKKDQIIEVVADNEVCGRLKILANDPTRYKYIPIVFVEIKAKFRGREIQGSAVSGGELFFLQGLKQAYTFPKNGKVVHVGMNMQSIIENEYCNANGIERTTGKYNKKKLEDYLDECLNFIYKDKYRDYYKLYFLDIYYPNSKSGLITQGYSPTLNCNHVMLFKGHDKSTIAHETMHAMGLPHTFDGQRAEFTYKAQQTDNIMDYCHWNQDIEGKSRTPVEGRTLFRWQMIKLNANLKNTH